MLCFERSALFFFARLIVDTCQSDRDQNVSLPRTCMLNPKETALEFTDEPANSVLSCAEAPLSPGKWYVLTGTTSACLIIITYCCLRFKQLVELKKNLR